MEAEHRPKFDLYRPLGVIQPRSEAWVAIEYEDEREISIEMFEVHAFLIECAMDLNPNSMVRPITISTPMIEDEFGIEALDCDGRWTVYFGTKEECKKWASQYFDELREIRKNRPKKS